MSKGHRKVDLLGTDLCPCESGLNFESCCQKKGIVFHRDGRGVLHKTFPINDELLDVLKNAEGRFVEVFGRKPKNDPVFFEKYFDSSRDYDRHFLEVSKLADVREEVVFATGRTGLIVTEGNHQKFNELELDEWNEAIDEYFFYQEEGIDPFVMLEWDSYEEFQAFNVCKEMLRDAVIHCGSYLEKNRTKLRDERLVLTCYFVVRVARVLRLVHHVFDERFSDDVLGLMRNVYEAYLRLRAIRLDRSLVAEFFAQIYLGDGQYEYVRKRDGKVDKNKIRNSADGTVYNSYRSLKYYADLGNDEIEAELYDYLSSEFSVFAHVKSQDIVSFMDEEGFLLHKSGGAARAVVLSAAVSLLFISEVLRIEGAHKTSARDMRFLAKKMYRHLKRISVFRDDPRGAQDMGPIVRKLHYLDV